MRSSQRAPAPQMQKSHDLQAVIIAVALLLVSIPGTIGGGLTMNAGCYGSEFKDVLISARMMDRTGAIHEMNASEMGMTYRHCDVAKDMIFLSATFHSYQQIALILRQR